MSRWLCSAVVTPHGHDLTCHMIQYLSHMLVLSGLSARRADARSTGRHSLIFQSQKGEEKEIYVYGEAYKQKTTKLPLCNIKLYFTKVNGMIQSNSWVWQNWQPLTLPQDITCLPRSGSDHTDVHLPFLPHLQTLFPVWKTPAHVSDSRTTLTSFPPALPQDLFSSVPYIRQMAKKITLNKKNMYLY